MSSQAMDSDQDATLNQQSPGQTADPFVRQIPIRLVKNAGVKTNVMRFNVQDFVPIEQWQSLKMWREKSEEQLAQQQQQEAGGTDSSYASKRSRKRFNAQAKKNKDEQKPWILNINGKKGRRYRGTRTGGIGDHATYYVFNTTGDGAIEAQRLDEFYNFQSQNRFTPLTAEEAEEEFKRRKRVLNLFSIMTRKRLLGEEKELEEAAASGSGGVGGTKKPASADLKITDMDEWMSSSDCETDADEEGAGNGVGKKSGGSEAAAANGNVESDSDADVAAVGNQKKTKQAKKQHKKRKNAKSAGVKGKKSKPENFAAEEHAFEDSDDGDNDGREVDYDSDSSEAELDLESKCAMKSVAEEDALRKLLNSESEADETEAQAEKSVANVVNTVSAEKQLSSDDEAKVEENVGKKVLPQIGAQKKHSLSKKKQHSKGKKLRSAALVLNASKCTNEIDLMNEKALKESLEKPSTSDGGALTMLTGNANDENSHLEEITKRYLSRKPISAVELLHKMKSKYSYMPNTKLLEKVTQVLKKINPVKSVSKGKMFFSLKKGN